jgi:hypothetical protein
MASGRPRRPNDPSVLASLETAVSSTSRSGMVGFCWHWRYELLIGAGLPGAALGVALMVGIGWLVAAASACALLTTSMLWRPSRIRLIARVWCVVTPHRVRTGCRNAWVQSRDGGLPVVLFTRPTEFGERVLLWCRAGITADDIAAARDIIRTTCWARDVRVIQDERHRHIVVLEVVRRGPVAQPGDKVPSWPYLPQLSQLSRGDMDGPDPEEPALSPWQEPIGNNTR